MSLLHHSAHFDAVGQSHAESVETGGETTEVDNGLFVEGGHAAAGVVEYIYAMPEFDGNVSSLRMSFYLKQSATKYQLQVGVMSDLSDPASFVPVATLNNSSTNVELVSVDFSSYSGNGRFIAFRNTLASGYSGDYSANFIDDITLRTASKGDLDDGSYGLEPQPRNITLYPNPTTGKLTIEADEDVQRVDVFDYTGRCVVSFEKQAVIDLGRLASGLYTLRMTLPDRIEVRRVVKQ